MKYNFKDITDTSIYDNTQVMFVVGQYNIFNNIVIDELKQRSEGNEVIEENKNLLAEFGILEENNSNIKVSNSVDLATFFDVINIPNVNGKWFCSADLGSMSKKHKDLVKQYMKKPSNNGILVVYSTEYKDFREYLYNRTLTQSPIAHIISLSFPNRTILVDIVRQLFEQRNIELEDRAIELFVMRLSIAYDDYETIIDRISIDWEGQYLDYKSMMNELKGVENFILDDLIEGLLVPVLNTSTSANKKMYRMVHSLIQEFGADKLVTRIRFKIEDYIQFRIAINTGVIPILTRYSVSEVKKKLGEEHKLNKINDFQFKRMASIAAKTSLKDWMYMRLILNNLIRKYAIESNEKVLYSLINRSNLTEVRLNNAIGIREDLSPDLTTIDNLVYIEGDKITRLYDIKNTKLMLEKLQEMKEGH